MTNAIPNDVALQMCEGIRKQNRGRWYSFHGIWCAMCNKVSRGDVKKKEMKTFGVSNMLVSSISPELALISQNKEEAIYA